MVLRLSDNPTIDNLRHYPKETVQTLRALLAAGALAHLDPRRQHFYEVENRSQVFYIHVYPHESKVLLLATWHKNCPAAT